MTDRDSKPAKIPFQRTDPEQGRIAFRRSDASAQTITSPDGSPLRDKDNAHPSLKPAYPARPAPNLAPGGAMGIRTGLAARSPDADPAQDMRFLPEFEEGDLAYDHGIEVDPDLHTEGRVLTMPGYSFIARVGDEPRPEGIGGGKIDQLALMKDGTTVARYDRGWEIEPTTAEQKEALHRVRTGLDDAPEKRISAPEHDQSNSHEIDR